MTFEEWFENNDQLVYNIKGVSMLPMLVQNRDVVYIQKKGTDRLKKDDVALFRRGKNYVLHRVIKVRENDYVFLGDNSINCEDGVREQDILGIMIGFEHDGEYVSVQDEKYLRYVRKINRTRSARITYKKGKALLACILRKLHLLR